MNIPDEAVEAAARELYYEERNTSEAETPWPEWDNLPFEPTWDGKEPYRELARAALKAAAPFIAAQERRDTARLFREKAKAVQESPGYSLTLYHMSVATLLDLADVLDRDADRLEAGA